MTITPDIRPSPCAICGSQDHIESGCPAEQTAAVAPEPEWMPRLRDDAMAVAKQIRDTFDDWDNPTLSDIADPFIRMAADFVRTREAMTATVQKQKAALKAQVARRDESLARFIERFDELEAEVARRDRALALQEATRNELEATVETLEKALGDGEYKERRWAGRCAASDPTGSTSALCNLEHGHDGRHHARMGPRGEGGSVVWEQPPPLQYVALSEIADGHVQALNLPDDDGLPVDCLCSFTSGVNPKCPVHGPSPEMREVPLGDAREGDIVTIHGKVERFPDPMGLTISADGIALRTLASLSRPFGGGITVTRPVSPLPDKPGAVGTATVRGVPGVRVMRMEDHAYAGQPWYSTRHIGRSNDLWHADSDLSDYVPLLDGQEGS